MGLGLKMGNIVGKTVKSIGTFYLGYETIYVWKTIDIKPYSLNYRSLTMSNFIIGGIAASTGGGGSEMNFGLSPSYNSSTGILTIGGGYFDGGRWWYPTVSVWLVE